MSSDPVEYAQDTFEDAYEEAKSDRAPILRESILRRIWAYGLKAIAVFSGIAIAAGVSEETAHILGITVAVVVALDSLFSNHERMGAVTKASQAYKSLLNEVRRRHQRELIPILKLKEADPENAKNSLLNLVSSLTEQMHSGCLSIEKALDEMNLKALSALALDREKAKDNQ